MAKKDEGKKVEGDDVVETAETVETPKPEAIVTPSTGERTITMKESDIRKMIAEAVQRATDQGGKPQKPKRVNEHFAHVWRINGKWVVDFVNQQKDPLVNHPLHSYNVYNTEKREQEAWIELMFQDGTTEKMPLNRYVQHRMLMNCLIKERKPIDTSYTIGEVEMKKDDGEKYIGSGVMVDQDVNQYNEMFTVETSDGLELHIPDYAIA